MSTMPAEESAGAVVVVNAVDLDPQARKLALDLLVVEVGDYFLAEGNDRFEVVALEGGVVIGAAVGSALDADDRRYMLDHLSSLGSRGSGVASGLIAQLEAGAPTGHLLALAVAPTARRRGVGAQLIEARLQAFADRAFRLAVAESWDKPEHSSVSVYDRLGFTRLGEVPRYWYRHDASGEGTSEGCPICGSPCTCSAVLFGRQL